MIHTIETRLKLNETQELLVNSCVVLWSTYYHKTWKLWNNQQLKEIAKNINIPYEELNNNQNIKYGVYRMQARFMEINNVEFCPKNQVKIIQTITNKQPITAKIIKKLGSVT